ncbi:putative hatpase domain protein [Gigaspora margarita]|uniref:Putative hatpase domain protein n=1 Tax=Gigaspora margarita TaxID=4874 RepID=A0A8H3X1R4_GIGMA|nr:putative hatpase domain protein [Gigaspora margarita]
MDELRKQVLNHTAGEERVEVNQRHLIDKILARYSAEFVVFRELMQNADDAKSSSVEIVYETQNKSADKSNILKDKCVRILFKNNGFAFRPEDWSRLKKIAEGNPDEQKIGAFGVGFYSLFSVCEEPFVSSGGQGMAFYWKGDQLFAKRAAINQEDQTWTTFLMDMRDHAEFPNAEDFGRFLATSLGFTGNLREVSVYFNDKRIIRITKKMSDPRTMTIFSGLNTTSPEKMFHLRSVDVRNVQLDVERTIIPSKFSLTRSTLNDYPTEETSIFLRVASGHLDVRVSRSFSADMERTTKKKPPSQTIIQMIFTGYDEQYFSEDKNKKISGIFKNLLPFPEQGRIFIGFPTHQTTGCSSHLAARLIPTVERESVDLVDKTLAVYNNEMLCLAGILSRILYEDEMSQISKVYKEIVGSSVKIDEATISVREWLEKRAAHALSHFTFKPSTPNPRIGQIIESLFLNCASQPLSIMSTLGVQPINSVRMPNSEMAAFIKTIPTVPKIVMEQCDVFIKKAKNKMNIIKDISLGDVFNELQNRTLSQEDTVALMKWWIGYRTKEQVSESDVQQLLKLAVVCIDDNVIPLNKIQYWLNPAVVPPDFEVPSSVLPYSISKSFLKSDIEKWFGGWKELSLAIWTQYITSKPQLENDPDFAEKVLGTIARSFQKCSSNDQNTIKQLLVGKKCIPTKHGLKIPDDSYFQNVDLFPDLPIINFQNVKVVEKLLQKLGVRKHVELQLIFDRLVSQGNWDHMQLVKYLASVANSLKEIELKRLKVTAIWPKEQNTKHELSSAKADGDEIKAKPRIHRFLASDLYAPSVEMREFGMPLIEWNGKWRKNSEEAKFLFSLGLREYPPLKVILQLADVSNSDTVLRSKALKYFMDNFKDKYSSEYKAEEIKVAFLPCTDPKVYETPMGCFSNPECTIMNFNALHQDLRFRADELGIRQHPSRERLLNRLIQNPPENEQRAKDIFGYLASRLGDFNQTDWSMLRDLNFIPIRDEAQTNLIKYVTPRNCFFKGSDETYAEFFSYVDFGEKANKFLLSCGLKTEPSPTEFAEFLVKSSQEFWNSVGDNVEKYLAVLRNIAVNYNSIYRNRSLLADMSRAPILIGIKKKEIVADKENFDYKGQDIDNYVLAPAKDIFLNDDTNFQHVFNPLTAPMEEILENFYKMLGSRSLSANVKASVQVKGNPMASTGSARLQKTIRERAQLFYHDIHRSDVKQSVDWVQKLKVMETDQIEATYELITNNQMKVEPIYSYILKDTRVNNSWTLYVTPGEPDYLDIASNLGKHIFRKCKWKDISHLAMLLTTPLGSLKRKGYPVDRIMLNYKKPMRVAEKYEIPNPPITPEVQPQANPKPSSNVSPIKLAPEIEEYANQLQEMFPKCDPNYIRQCLAQEKSDHLQKVANKLAESKYPEIEPKPQPNGVSDNEDGRLGTKKSGWGGSIFKSLSDLLPTNSTSSSSESPKPTLAQKQSQKTQPTQPNEVQKQQQKTQTTQPIEVTPRSTQHLRNALKDAVKSCRPNSGASINSQGGINIVSESQTSYCDVLPGHSLNFVGVDNGIELYIEKGSNGSEIFKTPALTRFINILKDLGEVFGVPQNSIHIFYDTTSNSIAFNRGKALFFNFRFYLGLHDEIESNKPSADTILYWFMTFCHELAHNFVGPHNSEHEYYFSSFAEIYMPNLCVKMKKRGLI